MFGRKKAPQITELEIADLELAYHETPTPGLARHVSLTQRDWAMGVGGVELKRPLEAGDLLFTSIQFSLLGGDLRQAIETTELAQARPGTRPGRYRELLVEAHGRLGDIDRAIAIAEESLAEAATAHDYFGLSSAFGIIAIQRTPASVDGEVSDRPLYERLATQAERWALLALQTGPLGYAEDLAHGFVYSARRAQGKPLDAADERYLAGAADRDPRSLRPFGNDWT